MANLIANKKSLRTLAAWINGGRLPHAVIVEGATGTGRKTFARLLAKAILCQKPADGAPCEVCRHCVKMNKGIHPDFEILEGGSGARSFHIETVRQMRIDASVKPNEADSRVFMMVDTQNMSIQAQNALLKIIEEPPKGVHFIMICENRSQMLETIRSRASVITMEALGIDDCANYLQERFPQTPQNEILSAASYANGNIGLAIDRLSANTGQENTETAKNVDLYSIAEATFTALIKGNELLALQNLFRYEKDRAAFLDFVSAMRQYVVAFLPSNNKTPGIIKINQAIKCLETIDSVYDAVRANASIPLLTCCLTCGIRQAFAD